MAVEALEQHLPGCGSLEGAAGELGHGLVEGLGAQRVLEHGEDPGALEVADAVVAMVGDDGELAVEASEVELRHRPQELTPGLLAEARLQQGALDEGGPALEQEVG